MASIKPEDHELMLAYASGDAAAFEQLYARHKNALYQYMLSSCANETHAGELYQDVWLRVVKNRNTYSSDSPFNAWLYQIARHRLIDHYRQTSRAPVMESHTDEHTASVSTLAPKQLTPEEVAHLNERADVLDNALQSIPDIQREAILLRHMAGMSINEIANVVDAGVETVKSRLRYAVAKLRSQLKELS